MHMRTRILWSAVLAALALPAMAAQQIRIVEEGGIRDEWTLPPGATLAAPGYPAEYAAGADEVCVAIGYLINPDGHTSDFALLKSWSSQDNSRARGDYWEAFAGAASGALAQWRFVPRAEVASPRPVYTVATFMFGPTASTATRERCALADVSTRLLELRYNDRAGRLMSSRSIFSRLAIDPTLEERFRRQVIGQRESREVGMPPLPPPPPPEPSGEKKR